MWRFATNPDEDPRQREIDRLTRLMGGDPARRNEHAGETIVDALDHAFGFHLQEVEDGSTVLRDYGDVADIVDRFAQWLERTAMCFEDEYPNILELVRHYAVLAPAGPWAAGNAADLVAHITAYVASNRYADTAVYTAVYAAERERQERWWRLALRTR